MSRTRILTVVVAAALLYLASPWTNMPTKDDWQDNLQTFGHVPLKHREHQRAALRVEQVVAQESSTQHFLDAARAAKAAGDHTTRLLNIARAARLTHDATKTLDHFSVVVLVKLTDSH